MSDWPEILYSWDVPDGEVFVVPPDIVEKVYQYEFRRLWRESPFHIDYPIEIKPTRSYTRVLDRVMSEAVEDIRKELNRPSYFSPILQKLDCDQRGMYSRLHTWNIEYYPARQCYNCDGLTWYIYDGEIIPCNYCTAGWIPEYWQYSCAHCNKSFTKGR